MAVPIATPEDFPMENIEPKKIPELKRGRRTTVTEEFRIYARERLDAWRDDLVEREYPGMLSITAGSLLHDDIIDKLVSQGKRFSSEIDLLSRVRWGNGMVSLQDPVPVPNERCRELFSELQDIYKRYDEAHSSHEYTEDDLDEDKDEAVGGASEGGGK